MISELYGHTWTKKVEVKEHGEVDNQSGRELDLHPTLELMNIVPRSSAFPFVLSFSHSPNFFLLFSPSPSHPAPSKLGGISPVAQDGRD